jgi:CII-binding regulator of phage lambda lysogenization HflD
MSEQELKTIISVYQQKTNDLMAQNVVLEAKLTNSNQLIEALTNKINELNEKNAKLSSSKKITKSSQNEDVDFA